MGCLRGAFRSEINIGESSCTIRDEFTNPYKDMVIDAICSQINDDHEAMCEQELPNYNAQKFYNLLNDVDCPLWNGWKTHTRLSAVSALLNLKFESNMYPLIA